VRHGAPFDGKNIARAAADNSGSLRFHARAGNKKSGAPYIQQ
jgi:hypothetical protein